MENDTLEGELISCHFLYLHLIPEECFQIFRQLGSSRIAWIHRDEKADTLLQLYILSEEIEDGFSSADGILDALHLHCNNRKYLDGDTVEFVKAAPRSRLGQAFVDVAN